MSIITNLDNKLTAKQVAEGVELERKTGIMDDAYEEARRNTGGDHFAVATSDEKLDPAQLSKRYLEEQAKARENWVIKPLRMVLGVPESPFGYRWELTESDFERVQQGLNCPCCLAPKQDTTLMHCNYRGGNGKGCGYSDLTESFHNDLKV